MYEATVTAWIAASHHLRGYQGKCETPHGHNYKVEATVGRPDLDSTGLSIDFGILRKHLHTITEAFDHTDLNGLPEFAEQNPSSENLARTIYEKLAISLKDLPVQLVTVRVSETDGSFVTYRPPGSG